MTAAKKTDSHAKAGTGRTPSSEVFSFWSRLPKR